MVLRMRAVDMVEDAGYTPIEALDAAEAVAILESRSDVALMCTDIQMPGQMDGIGLAHAVHERWPSDQDHRGIGTIGPAAPRSTPPQQVSRQAAQCRGSDSGNARHDRQRLRRQCFSRRIGPKARDYGKIRAPEDQCGTQPMMIQSVMSEADLRTDPRPASSAAQHHDDLAEENVSLRLLLAQAEIDARSLLATAGIDAREREASDKLQKLILEELHHRIKNTLATVGAIVSQSLRRSARLPSTRSKPSRAGCSRSDARTICFCRQDGAARTLPRSSAAPPKPSIIPTSRNSRFRDPISG